jgi:hypothetical protein
MKIESNQEGNEIYITIPTFTIKMNGSDKEMDIPHKIFLINNITKNKISGFHYSLSLIEEYMMILENYFQKQWFSFDGKIFYNSSNVNQIIVGEEKDLIIKNPNWSEDGRLISFSNIYSDIKEKVSKPELLLEKKEIKLKAMDRLIDLRKKF